MNAYIISGFRSAVGKAPRGKFRFTRPDDLAARYGGEEFALLLPDTTAEGALGVAENVRARVADMAVEHSARGDELSIVTVSLGVSTLVPEDSGAPSRLIQAADAALYAAKQQGRNRAVQG